MTRVNGLLALVLGATLVLAGCGGNDGNDEDTGTDITADLPSDLSSDGIPDPSTEPPAEVVEDAPVEGWGDARVGEACEENTDCGGVPSPAPSCLTDIMGYVEFPGGYCTADGCTSDEECGDAGEGTCLNLYIMSICVKNCTESSECRTSEGYECGELPSMLGIPGTFCIPAFEMPDMPPDAATDPEEDPAEDSTAD